MKLSIFHLFIHEAVEDVDEEALETVEDGEDVSESHGLCAHEKQAKGPGETQQYNQHHSTLDPRSAAQHIHAQITHIYAWLGSHGM